MGYFSDALRGRDRCAFCRSKLKHNKDAILPGFLSVSGFALYCRKCGRKQPWAEEVETRGEARREVRRPSSPGLWERLQASVEKDDIVRKAVPGSTWYVMNEKGQLIGEGRFVRRSKWDGKPIINIESEMPEARWAQDSATNTVHSAIFIHPE